MGYEHLTAGERAHYDEYGKLRSITALAGFAPEQAVRRDAARSWLEHQRVEIFNRAEGRVSGVAAGWDHEHRRERYAMLTPETLTKASARREVRLPAAGCLPVECAYVAERGAYLALTLTTDDQRARKVANLDWLVNRRQQVFAVATEHGWDAEHRRERYNALAIATSHGEPYKAWQATHDPKTGLPLPTTSNSSRARALAWLTSREGITEQPANSNTDSRPDGIAKAQWYCANSSHGLDKTPWCGEWSWRAFNVAKVPGIGTWWMASVREIESRARRRSDCYSDWRSGFDTRGVQPGDQVVIGGSGHHVETVREVHSDHIITNGGNTSPGSGGSQSNGGGAYRRRRVPKEVTGFALVKHVVDVKASQGVAPTEFPPVELTPEEQAAKLAGEQELAAGPPPISGDPGVAGDPASDDGLAPELADAIAVEDEERRAAEAAEEALIAQQDGVEDPADGVVPEPAVAG